MITEASKKVILCIILNWNVVKFNDMVTKYIAIKCNIHAAISWQKNPYTNFFRPIIKFINYLVYSVDKTISICLIVFDNVYYNYDSKCHKSNKLWPEMDVKNCSSFCSQMQFNLQHVQSLLSAFVGPIVGLLDQ